MGRGILNKRILITLVSVVSLLAAQAVAAGPAAAVDIKVSTAQDTPQATSASAVDGCLGQAATSAVKPNLTAAETQLKDAGAPMELEECSFRMALLAAAASPNNGDEEDRIVFDSKLKDKTIAIDNNTPLPPIVDSATTATVGRAATIIDGCDGMGITGRPCINIQLPGNTVNLDDLAAKPSLVPGGAPGLIVAARRVEISGLAFQGGNPAIMTIPDGRVAASVEKFVLKNSYFGLSTDGTEGGPKPRVAVQIHSTGATIGGTTAAERNIFASGDIGVLIAGAENTTVQGNWFGANANGTPFREPLEIGVRLTGLGADANPVTKIVDRALGRDNEKTAFQTPLILKNFIGGELTPAQAASSACDGPCNLFVATEERVSDNPVAIDVGGRPLTSEGTVQVGEVGNPSVGSPGGDGPFVDGANTVDNAGKVVAEATQFIVGVNVGGQVDPVGVKGTRIQGNQIGVTNAGGKGDVRGHGILVRNGSHSTTIGGDARTANVISNTGGAGVAVDKTAGSWTNIAHFTGHSNLEPLIDLGTGPDGADVGNSSSGPSGGVQAPTISAGTSSSVSGTTAGGATIHVYKADPPHGTGRGDVSGFLGTTTANGSGQWSLAISTADRSYVTATANAGRGTSELAENFQVVDPPPPPPPPEPEPEPVVPTPPAPVKSADGDAPPRPVTVMGKRPSEDNSRPTPVSPTRTTLKGEISDPDGIKEVRVALRRINGPVRKRALKRKRSRKKSRKSANASFHETKHKAQSKSKKKSTKKKSKKKRSKRKARRCVFVSLKTGKQTKRTCSNPPFVETDGTEDWKLKLSTTTRKRINRLARQGFHFQLFVKATDTFDNARVSRVPIKITVAQAKAARKRGGRQISPGCYTRACARRQGRK